jgi:hypothetical protein
MYNYIQMLILHSNIIVESLPLFVKDKKRRETDVTVSADSVKN